MNTPSRPTIAFLGLGLMGGGMARRLLSADFPLTVYNRSPEKGAALVAEGARWAATPRAAAAGASVVLSMVADDAAARSVWLGGESAGTAAPHAGAGCGPEGALAGADPGTVLLECSTVSVAWITELAAAARARSCEFLDAPVTGSRLQAAAGQLNFLVGGPAETLERVRPVLAAMSASIVALGPVGSGAILKLINNFVCGVQAAALAEAMAMIERSGLDRTKAVALLAGGAPGSPMVKALSARMAASDYAPNFLLRLMAKDLAYARDEGFRFDLDLTTASAALRLFERAIDAGQGDRDLAAVIEPLRQK